MQAPLDSRVVSVPARALGISLAALSVAVASAIFFGESLGEAGHLLWLLALIPAFLLAHYRGWRNIGIALGAGMVFITLVDVFVMLTGREMEDWPLFFFVVGVYIALALGGGWLTEIRWRIQELEQAEQEARRAYAELSKSHEELKATQLQLIQAEKLDSVGRLAAGVAHEVKNPLMTILWGVRYISEHHPPEEENVAQLLEDMSDAVGRANAVIMDLLDFSAPRELDLRLEDLNSIVSRSVSLLKHEWNRSRITVVKELADGLPRLMLDRFKLQQVLVNILMNSVHAVPGGGRVTIKTYYRPAPSAGANPEVESADRFMTNGNIVVLEVEDTGTGIPQDKLVKVFDPFFTTKPPGKGSGLGLSVVRQIVEMHGGQIEIGNREEGGVRVKIGFTLPQGGTHDAEETHPGR
jgi:signal transduction histidine kinase